MSVLLLIITVTQNHYLLVFSSGPLVDFFRKVVVYEYGVRVMGARPKKLIVVCVVTGHVIQARVGIGDLDAPDNDLTQRFDGLLLRKLREIWLTWVRSVSW